MHIFTHFCFKNGYTIIKNTVEIYHVNNIFSVNRSIFKLSFNIYHFISIIIGGLSKIPWEKSQVCKRSKIPWNNPMCSGLREELLPISGDV